MKRVEDVAGGGGDGEEEEGRAEGAGVRVGGGGGGGEGRGMYDCGEVGEVGMEGGVEVGFLW